MIERQKFPLSLTTARTAIAAIRTEHRIPDTLAFLFTRFIISVHDRSGKIRLAPSRCTRTCTTLAFWVGKWIARFAVIHATDWEL
jgi:hypothetical protein